MRKTFLAIASLVFGNCAPWNSGGSPDISPDQAAAIISSSSGFNRYRRVISVEATNREGDSLAECCYSASFTLRVADSPTNIPAHAEFRFISGRWYLFQYSYGKPPNREIVSVADGPDTAKSVRK